MIRTQCHSINRYIYSKRYMHIFKYFINNVVGYFIIIIYYNIEADIYIYIYIYIYICINVIDTYIIICIELIILGYDRLTADDDVRHTTGSAWRHRLYNCYVITTARCEAKRTHVLRNNHVVVWLRNSRGTDTT